MYERTYSNRVLGNRNINPSAGGKKPRRFSPRRLISLLIAFAILAGVYFALRSSHLQITNVTVNGTNVIDTNEVQTLVRDNMKGTWLWIFPRTSIFLVKGNQIEQHLKNKFSRIETVGVKKTSLNTLTVSIKEYEASYLWCDPGEVCYLMDSRGAVYNRAPEFSGIVYPKVTTWSPVEELPFQAIDLPTITFITDMDKRLQDININPLEFKLLSEKKMEIDFAHNGDISQFLVDPTIPLDTSLEYLYSAIREKTFSDLFNNNSKKLLYIDVRFSNKVVYKFAE